MEFTNLSRFGGKGTSPFKGMGTSGKEFSLPFALGGGTSKSSSREGRTHPYNGRHPVSRAKQSNIQFPQPGAQHISQTSTYYPRQSTRQDRHGHRSASIQTQNIRSASGDRHHLKQITNHKHKKQSDFRTKHVAHRKNQVTPNHSLVPHQQQQQKKGHNAVKIHSKGGHGKLNHVSTYSDHNKQHSRHKSVVEKPISNDTLEMLKSHNKAVCAAFILGVTVVLIPLVIGLIYKEQFKSLEGLGNFLKGS